jgi:hypothetical protein
MKTYTVPVTYSFSGMFFIQASSAKEAREYADHHCGLVMGGHIESTLDDNDVDWDFPCHPDKKIGECR